MPQPAQPAVIFDLDGTLVDSEPAYFEAGRRLMASHGVTYDWATHARFIGVSTRETLATLRRDHPDQLGGTDLDTLLAAKNALYIDLVPGHTKPFPRMVEFVDLLRDAGVPLCVASGSSRPAIDAALAAADLADRFAFTLSADEVAHGKPAPEIFLAAAERLGAPPAACTVVEDAVPGIEAARRAGCRCVAVPFGPEAAADPETAAAGLVFPGGQEDFDPRRAFAFVMETAPGAGMQ